MLPAKATISRRRPPSPGQGTRTENASVMSLGMQRNNSLHLRHEQLVSRSKLLRISSAHVQRRLQCGFFPRFSPTARQGRLCLDRNAGRSPSSSGGFDTTRSRYDAAGANAP
jgi:hypothetical protein